MERVKPKRYKSISFISNCLETELDNTNRHLVYWSQRALNAEKKLQMIQGLMMQMHQRLKITIASKRKVELQ
ncbi:MAG: hypothetical protein CM15mV37_0170 [uncultured marine virus]|nr:MAG: hypothetical protein CM15mV37_0170 [uncultured marine virus]